MNAKDFDAFMRKCMNEAPTPDDGRYLNPRPLNLFGMMR
jgi:hypothetical protein